MYGLASFFAKSINVHGLFSTVLFTLAFGEAFSSYLSCVFCGRARRTSFCQSSLVESWHLVASWNFQVSVLLDCTYKYLTNVLTKSFKLQLKYKNISDVRRVPKIQQVPKDKNAIIYLHLPTGTQRLLDISSFTAFFFPKRDAVNTP